MEGNRSTCVKEKTHEFGKVKEKQISLAQVDKLNVRMKDLSVLFPLIKQQQHITQPGITAPGTSQCLEKWGMCNNRLKCHFPPTFQESNLSQP